MSEPNEERPTTRRGKTEYHPNETTATTEIDLLHRANELLKPLPGTFSELGGNLDGLLAKNKAWADLVSKVQPGYFEKTAKEKQKPKILWIGCSDSRVPAEIVVQMNPGEIFVHRNIANQFVHTDLNSLSVLQYAVEHLGIEHVIVCGHYGCGGVEAALSNNQNGIVDHWLLNIKDVYNRNSPQFDTDDKDQKWNRLVKLNVIAQVQSIASTSIVQNAWKANKKLEVHGWVYDLKTGYLEDLECNIRNTSELPHPIYTCIH
ncbi:7303_t:CDS:2 [Ambispora leptoticha]|uniref:Carbonic anhydrase n=1 Tax=Ambispora leptoticha TaxID=144679 RepID=A0A9N9AVH0_9GLOM|nr:7303_t:CDS:2 [Ambispora leptoticha]